MKDNIESLNDVYEKGELVYYCNACGDINIPGTDPWSCHSVRELPPSVRYLYEKYWIEGAGLCMYVVKYLGMTCMAVTALFDYSYIDDLSKYNEIDVTPEEFFAAVKITAKKYNKVFRYETLLGQDTDPDGHEIVFIIPANRCENVREFTSYVGSHIYEDFEDECKKLIKERGI